MLSVQHVRKEFPSPGAPLVVLKDVSFRVAPITRYAPGTVPPNTRLNAGPYDPNVPLEAQVERQPLRQSAIAEGTVYALLVRIEQRGLVDVQKVPSEKGPPRKVYTLNAHGREYLEEFWSTWGFLAGRLEQLREGGN